MPYDPNLPQENTPADAAQIRGQFAGIKEFIDAIVTIVAAQIAGVTTLDPGQPAGVNVSVVGDTLHFTFGIPRGADGAQGPPFAQAIVDAVNTLAPGSNATVTVSFDGTNVHLTFGIPAGATGADGEVTNAALDAAIATTALNPSGIGPFAGSFSDPVTQAEMQAFAAYVETLRVALVR